MAGSERVIAILNVLLVQEFSAINQYLVNRGRYQNWQLSELVQYIDERIADEQKHYTRLVDRVLFLGGAPSAGRLDPLSISHDVVGTFNSDSASELTAIKTYNEAIALAREVGDNGTVVLLEENLKDEEDHINDLTAKRAQISLMGLQVFLGQQA